MLQSRHFFSGHRPSGHIPEYLTDRIVRIGSQNQTRPTAEAKELQADTAEKTNQTEPPADAS